MKEIAKISKAGVFFYPYFRLKFYKTLYADVHYTSNI